MSIPYTLTNFLDGLSWWLTEPGMARDLNLGTYQELARGLKERGAQVSASELAVHIQVIARSSQGLNMPVDEFTALLHAHLPEILIQVMTGINEADHYREIRLIPADELERILSIFRQHGFPASAGDAANLLHCLWWWLYPPFVSVGQNVALEHLASYRDRMERELTDMHPALRQVLGQVAMLVAVNGDGTNANNPLPDQIKVAELCLLGRHFHNGHLASVLDQPHGLAVLGTTFRDLAIQVAGLVQMLDINGESYELTDEEVALYSPIGRLSTQLMTKRRPLPSDPDPVGTRLFFSNANILNGIARWVVEFNGPRDFLFSVYEASAAATERLDQKHVDAITVAMAELTGLVGGIEMAHTQFTHHLAHIASLHRQHVEPYVIGAAGKRLPLGDFEEFRPFVTFLCSDVCGGDVIAASWIAHLIDPGVFTPLHHEDEIGDIAGYLRYAQNSANRVQWRDDRGSDFASSFTLALLELVENNRWEMGAGFPYPLTLAVFLSSRGRQKPRFIGLLDPATPPLTLKHFAKVPLLDSYRVIEILLRQEFHALTQLIVRPTLDDPDQATAGLTPSELLCLPYLPRAIPRRPDGSTSF